MVEELTLSQIVEINTKIGASGKLLNRGNLEFIISEVSHAKTFLDKAALLFYEIVNLHPFVDGNKRTAFTAMTVFLRLNGKVIKSEVTQDHIERIAYDLATGNLSKEELKELINKMIK